LALPLPSVVANETAKRLLARVKALREALGLSQEAFAEKAGLGYKYYQHVESGRRRDIRLSTIEKLAKACGLELWKLLNFDEAAKEKILDSREAPSAETKNGRSKNKSPVNKITKGRAKSSASNLDH
jgi:transcriptional regulator with XRE-family HTH domain